MPEVAGVQLVAVRDGLLRLVTCLDDFRLRQVPGECDPADHRDSGYRSADADVSVQRLRKYQSHPGVELSPHSKSRQPRPAAAGKYLCYALHSSTMTIIFAQWST